MGTTRVLYLLFRCHQSKFVIEAVLCTIANRIKTSNITNENYATFWINIRRAPGALNRRERAPILVISTLQINEWNISFIFYIKGAPH